MKLALRLALGLAVAGAACSGSKSSVAAKQTDDGTAASAPDREAEPEPELEGYGVPVERADGKRAWIIPNSVKPPAQKPRPADDAVLHQHNQEAARQRFKGDTPFYLDGKLIAAVRYNEIPPWLPTHWETLADGRRVPRFVFARYLEALGIDIGKVKQVHLHGGRGRVAIASGAELRKVADELLFSFTQGEQGKMRMHWGPKFQVSDTIDKVMAVKVYIATEPPTWSMRHMALLDGKGQPIRDLSDELRGAVRVYLDGRIAFLLKRKELANEGIQPARMDDEAPVYRLLDYLRSRGIDPARIAAVELVDRDELVARVDGKQWVHSKDAPLEFAAPKKSGGQVEVHYTNHAGKGRTRVTAISLYTARRATAAHRR